MKSTKVELGFHNDFMMPLRMYQCRHTRALGKPCRIEPVNYVVKSSWASTTTL